MSTGIQPNFDKPRILVIDMTVAATEALRSAGFNVTVGTFGSLSQVKQSGALHHVELDTVCLPHLEEQEIVIVNTATKPSINRGAIPTIGSGVASFWQRGVYGTIDPRPLAMHLSHSKCDHILRHGGIFIVLLSERYEITYVSGTQNDYDVDIDDTHSLSNWGFLSQLDALRTNVRNGIEIRFTSPILKRASTGAHFSCEIEAHSQRQADRWVPVAINKFKQTVGALMIPTED